MDELATPQAPKETQEIVQVPAEVFTETLEVSGSKFKDKYGNTWHIQRWEITFDSDGRRHAILHLEG